MYFIPQLISFIGNIIHIRQSEDTYHSLLQKSYYTSIKLSHSYFFLPLGHHFFSVLELRMQRIKTYFLGFKFPLSQCCRKSELK